MNVNYSSFPSLYRYVYEEERKTTQAFLPTFLAEKMPQKTAGREHLRVFTRPEFGSPSAQSILCFLF